MRLYLVRHGDARPKEEDPERSLSEKGERDVRKIADFLRSAGVSVGRIAHSGRKRALQTAEIIASALNVRELYADDALDPEADPRLILERIREDEDIMLVGHLPHLSRLISFLLTGSSEKEVVEIASAGAVCLERRDNTWLLLWAVRPDIIRPP